MWALFVALSMVSIPVCKGGDFQLLDVDELSIDLYKVQDYRQTYWVEDYEQMSHGVNINFNLRACRYLFMENQLHMLGTDSQLRQGGLHWRSGVNLGPYLDIYYEHHSNHVLERGRETREFPLENYYGARFYFLRK